jgi:hypothetical protein
MFCAADAQNSAKRAGPQDRALRLQAAPRYLDSRPWTRCYSCNHVSNARRSPYLTGVANKLRHVNNAIVAPRH